MRIKFFTFFRNCLFRFRRGVIFRRSYVVSRIYVKDFWKLVGFRREDYILLGLGKYCVF